MLWFTASMRAVEVAAARYRLGRASGQSLIALGEQLLAEGHDEAVKLAVADDPALYVVGPLFEALCSQLGQPIPVAHEAADIIAAAILREIVDRLLEPEEGLKQLMDDVYWPHVQEENESSAGHYVGEPHGLQHLIGAYWSYEELRERPTELSIDGEFGEAAIRLLDEQVRSFARDWLETRRVGAEWVCNAAMRQLLLDLERDSASPGIEMPPWLCDLLASGLVEQDGALLLRQQQAANAAHTRREQFPDLTGYEAFINHFHLPARDDTLDDLRLALASVEEIHKQLYALPIERPVRICVSRGLTGDYVNSTVRLYRVRPSEPWLMDDLESYQTEAVAYLDVEPPRLAD